MAECIASDYMDDSLVKVKKISSFSSNDDIKFIAAVDCRRAWLVEKEIMFGHGGATLAPVKLVDNAGKVLVSISLYGKVHAITADGLGNCYLIQGKDIYTISSAGVVKLLLNNREFSILDKQIACHMTGNGYVLNLMTRIPVSFFSSMKQYVNAKLTPSVKILTFDLNGKLIGEFIPQRTSDTILLKYLHFNTTCGLGSNAVEFYDMNGEVTHAFGYTEKSGVFLDQLPFNQADDTALIDVKFNTLLQDKLAETRNKQKDPADVLLDEVVESCIKIASKQFCRGFENSIWTLRNGVITVYQCT